MKRKVSEAIEKLGKDTESINQFDVIPEVKPEDIKPQAVAPVSYVAAVEQSKKEKDKFIKMVDEKTKSAQGLDNKDEDRFKHMSKETGKSTLNVDQPGLKKMHLDESLFEIVGTEDESLSKIKESLEEIERYELLVKDSLEAMAKNYRDGKLNEKIYRARLSQIFNIIDRPYPKTENINESKDKLVFNEDDEERLKSLAKEYDIDIIAYDDLIHFQVAGKVSDIKDFEEAYYKAFKKELELYGDTEGIGESLNEGLKEKILALFAKKKLDKYIDISDIVDDVVKIFGTSTPKADNKYKMKAESLNEGVQEYDGWNDDEISDLDHWGVISDIESLIYEIRSARRGVYTRAKTADELGQYVKGLADQLDLLGDEIIVLGDSEEEEEEIEESLNESKQPLKEATVISDVKTFKPWNGAIATYEKIQEEDKLDQLEAMIKEMYPDGIEAQTLNDLLWFDNEFVYSMLNIKMEEE